jgi:hypothetical protein
LTPEGVVQRKLAIGRTDDPLEHEADRVADRIMRMPDPALRVGKTPDQISRKCAECEEEDKQEQLQMKPAAASPAQTGQARSVLHDVLPSRGQPLDVAARAYFEPRFGQDFSDVRLHTDDRAADSAMSLGASAYTAGTDIAFATGLYDPLTTSGRRLLAHELTHVVQQRTTSSNGPFSGTTLIQRDADSDDYKQGYQDGLSGADPQPGPRDGDALTDYNEGYAKGHYEFSQQTSSAAAPAPAPTPTAPSPSESPAPAPTPAATGGELPTTAPTPGTTPPTVSDDYKQGYQDGLNGGDSAPGPRDGDALTDYNEGYAKGHYEFTQRSASTAPGTQSDDYKQGYQDGLNGRDSAPGPRDGDALTDYNEGYAKGHYEFTQQPAPGAGTESAGAAPDTTPAMSIFEKLVEAGKRGVLKFGPEAAAKFQEELPGFVGGLIVWQGLHAVAAGEVLDLLGTAALWAWLGKDALTVLEDLLNYVTTAISATKDSDLTAAGNYLSHALALISVDALLLALGKIAGGPKKGTETPGAEPGTETPGTETPTESQRPSEEEGAGTEAENIPEGITNDDVHIEDLNEPARQPGEREIDLALCFPGDTLVATPRGRRPIEDIKAGQLVYAFDFDVDQVVTRRVSGITRGTTARWIEVNLGTETVRATPGHPFWCESLETWTTAQELTPGMTLWQCDGGAALVKEVSESRLDEPEVTYNFSVDKVENYFVGAGAVLVHNTITDVRLKYLRRWGYRNYVLIAKDGTRYYSGMCRQWEDTAGLMRRHGANGNRFNFENGDRVEFEEGVREYFEARLMEVRTALKDNLVIGKNSPKGQRGNIQRPLASSKEPEYLEAEKFKENCG